MAPINDPDKVNADSIAVYNMLQEMEESVNDTVTFIRTDTVTQRTKHLLDYLNHTNREKFLEIKDAVKSMIESNVLLDIFDIVHYLYEWW